MDDRGDWELGRVSYEREVYRVEILGRGCKDGESRDRE